MSTAPEVLGDDVVVHRIGGGSLENLAIKAAEKTLNPPGISAHQGGTPEETAEAMRRHFPRMAPRGATTVGTTTVGSIRAAGFDVIINPTPRFPQHVRLIHPAGAAGFTTENLAELARRFENRTGL